MKLQEKIAAQTLTGPGRPRRGVNIEHAGTYFRHPEGMQEMAVRGVIAHEYYQQYGYNAPWTRTRLLSQKAKYKNDEWLVDPSGNKVSLAKRRLDLHEEMSERAKEDPGSFLDILRQGSQYGIWAAEQGYKPTGMEYADVWNAINEIFQDPEARAKFLARNKSAKQLEKEGKNKIDAAQNPYDAGIILGNALNKAKRAFTSTEIASNAAGALDFFSNLVDPEESAFKELYKDAGALSIGRQLMAMRILGNAIASPVYDPFEKWTDASYERTKKALGSDRVDKSKFDAQAEAHRKLVLSQVMTPEQVNAYATQWEATQIDVQYNKIRDNITKEIHTQDLKGAAGEFPLFSQIPGYASIWGIDPLGNTNKIDIYNRNKYPDTPDTTQAAFRNITPNEAGFMVQSSDKWNASPNGESGMFNTIVSALKQGLASLQIVVNSDNKNVTVNQTKVAKDSSNQTSGSTTLPTTSNSPSEQASDWGG